MIAKEPWLVTISCAATTLVQGSSAQILVANSPGEPHDAAVTCRAVRGEQQVFACGVPGTAVFDHVGADA